MALLHKGTDDNNPRILVVDDEPRLLDSLRDLVAMRGYQVRTAANGRTAIAALEGGQFDIVLLDLALPDMTGHQLMDAIAQRNIDTTIVVVSGDASINAAINALRKGAYDFVRKPYQLAEMLKTIENALNKRRLEKENERINKKLHQSERWYRYLVDNSPDIIYTLDHEGRFTFVNDRVETVLGFKRRELIGKPYSALVYEEDVNAAVYVFNERRTGERSTRNAELRLKCKDGSKGPRSFENRFVTVELNSMGIYDHSSLERFGRFIGTYGVAKDITDRKKAEETISYQAYHDLLTGLPNRALFQDRLGLAIAQARRNGQMLAVMFLDLDRFKVVNDTLGHVAGDELLQGVSTRLRGCLREGDTLARVGGDEFILLLPQVGCGEDAVKTARKILAAFTEPFPLDSRELFASVSIGISLFPDHGETMDTLTKHADIAMYHAKSLGRNNYQIYSQTMNVSHSDRLSLENDMRKALEREQFEVFYQPQFDVGSGRIGGMEALIRWRHPTRGLLPPSDFIPLAEETGMIIPMGEWVLRTVCGQLKAWRSAGLPPVTAAVNLSAPEIEQQHFAEKLIRMVQGCGLDNLLKIEITESVIMKDMENTISKLNKLSLVGVEICIDDFGTGYSSLSYLRKLPIHTIKIDQSFVRDILKDAGGTSIVTAIVAMAKGLKLHLVAEGVETESQYEFLRSLGCDEIQGFLFSGPLSAGDATELLAGKGHAAPRLGRAAAQTT